MKKRKDPIRVTTVVRSQNRKGVYIVFFEGKSKGVTITKTRDGWKPYGRTYPYFATLRDATAAVIEKRGALLL